MSKMPRRGLMFVLSSPSGAGKTTITRRLLELDKELDLSISCTTRPKRPGEEEGTDYYFVDEARFQEMIKAKDFLEYAKVFGGHYYGTPLKKVDEALEAGRDILFDIDWQGTQQLADKRPQDLVTVFILPPSREELERRLRARGRDTEDDMALRMEKADEEITHHTEYDYVLINDDIEETVARVQNILLAERLKRHRQRGLYDFVQNLKNK